MRQVIFFIALLSGNFLAFGQAITTIKGYAPKYIGKSIEVNEIIDFLSLREERMAVTTVQKDSTFSLSFANDKTQKIVIRSNNNFSYLYIEPGKTYEILLPLHDKDKPYRPLGNYVTAFFLNLEESDLNTKIINFDTHIDQFYASNVYSFVRNKQKFLDKYKALKDSIYQSLDTNDRFYNGYVHYSFADLDLSIYTSELSDRYIFDSYLSKRPVLYDNELYFSLIKKLYSKLFSQLRTETNNKVYKGILKKSPTLIIQALEEEYKLHPIYVRKEKEVQLVHSNEQLRELVMIYGLASVYNDDEYPKTNVLEVLDSIRQHPIFPENGIIANNIHFRLTEVTAGNPAPDFALTDLNGQLINLSKYQNKYLYIHLFKPEYGKAKQDLDLLTNVYNRYKDLVDFVTIYPTVEKSTKKIEKLIQSIPWEVVELDAEDNFFKTYNVQSFPYYILIDRTGVVVAAPALGPYPDGEYMTIDKTFFDIQKMDQMLKEREKERRRKG